ncbi:MAG TPA: hypothetical protein VKA00_08065, partial [Trueperaceae bacterium]|nr:hypothetical protein [Trueperaceae bacterium]
PAAKMAPAEKAAEHEQGADEVLPLPAGEVELHHGLTVIETSDAADLAALLSDPRVAALVVARIGERAALVLPRSAERLMLELTRSGRSPTVIGDR